MAVCLNATSINPGIFIGKARFLSSRTPVISARHISPQSVDHELKTLHEAFHAASAQINELLDGLPEHGSEREIFETHQDILHDPVLLTRLDHLVKNDLQSAPQAVETAFSEAIGTFNAMHNDFFAQRAADYRDLQERLLLILLGQDADPLAGFSAADILICQEPNPSLVTSMAARGIKAWVSHKGAYTSHAAILTRGLDIVALSGVQDLSDQVSDGQTLVVDAVGALLIIDPDPETLKNYRHRAALDLQARQQDISHAMGPAITLTGFKVDVMANIELPSEVDQLRAMGAEGVGLFRTEFLYLNRSELPGEEEQYQIYRQVAQAMAPYPVTIRSFDLGGDKISHLIPAEPEENPYLGCRGIRFSLARPELFKTQLKAVLRAALEGNVKLMLPMVNDETDIRATRELISQCRTELKESGVDCAEAVPLGVMIEVPSAALCAAGLAREADFFSIGTNDLAQYTLAVDRNSESLSHKYILHHPAVLKLISLCVETAGQAGISVSVCGEMASIPRYIPVLVGMKVDGLSVHPHCIATAKAIVRRCDAELDTDAGTLAQKDLAGIAKQIDLYQRKYCHTE